MRQRQYPFNQIYEFDIRAFDRTIHVHRSHVCMAITLIIYTAIFIGYMHTYIHIYMSYAHY